MARPGSRPRQQTPSPDSSLDKFITDTQAYVQNVTKALGMDELPDTQQIIDKLHNQATTLANNVNEFTDKLKTEVKAHQPEVDNAIKQVEAKLTETANSLKQAVGPEATAKAKEIKEKVDQGLKDAVEQVQKLVKAVEPDAAEAKAKVETVAKDLLQKINEVGKNLQEQVESNIQQHEKAHKKN